MTQIVNGQLTYNELTSNSNGGTEIIARKMIRDIPQDLLQGFQIIHSRIREIEPDLKKILVIHDLAGDPEFSNLTDPEYRKQFEKLVFVSNWQQHTFNMVHGIPFNESYVIRNGIDIQPYQPKSTEGPIRLIYHTTPHRGLAILASVMPILSKHHDIHLDVFSSFEIYGWGQRNQQYQQVFEALESMPNVTNHGFQPNDVVRSYLNQSHIFAFPSIWQETSCLSVIEALTHGNFVVTSNLGSLAETCIGLADMYMYSEDIQQHANVFANRMHQMLSRIENNRELANEHSQAISTISSNSYDWNVVKNNWINFLDSIKNERLVY